jgi:hypothetical protein
MTTPDPFAPRGTLSPELLKAYAEGRLEGSAAHEVELHLEADPLLREAVEGYRMPGAVAGVATLGSHRPNGAGTSWAAWALSAIVIATAGIALHYGTNSAADNAQDTTQRATVPSPSPDAEGNIAPQEIQAAIEIPESLHIGHSATERHVLSAISVQASAPVDTATHVVLDAVAPRHTTAPAGAHAEAVVPEKHRHPSLQLVYLHDLKLIHPKELYGRSPVVDATATGVDARYSSATDRDQARAQERRMAYLTFMDEALEKFAHNDHKGCLEELCFVLDQYPDDVNALFYAGLCCYNLGMDKRAEQLLQRAATHTFPVFDEEAEWYHALALQRLGENDAAHQAFQRIAQEKGFYAERAGAKAQR